MTSASGSPQNSSIIQNKNEIPNCETQNDALTPEQKITDLEDLIYLLQDENDSLRYRLQKMKQKMKAMQTQSFIFSNINITNKQNKVKCNKLMEEVHFITDLKDQIEKLSTDADEAQKRKRIRKTYSKDKKGNHFELDEDEPIEQDLKNENNENNEEKNLHSSNFNNSHTNDISNDENTLNNNNLHNENTENNNENDNNNLNNTRSNKKYDAISNDKNAPSFEIWVHNYYDKIDKFSAELDKKIQELMKNSEDNYNQIKKSDSLNQKLKHIHSKFQNLSNDLCSVKIENKNLKNENQSLKAELDTIKEENQQIKSELESINVENQKLKSEAELIKQENQQLKSTVENAKTENQRLRSFNQKSKAYNQKLKSEIESAKTENQSLKSDSQLLNEELQKLRAENQSIKSENFILKSDKQKILTENQSLKAENQTLAAENQMTKDQLKLQAQNEKKPKIQRDKLVESQKNMITQLQSQLQLNEKNLKTKAKQEKDSIVKLNSKVKSFYMLMDKAFGKPNAQRLIKTNSRQIMNKINDLSDKIQELQDKIQQLQLHQHQIAKTCDYSELPKLPLSVDKAWKEILDIIKPISPSQGPITLDLFNAYLDRIIKAVSNQDLTDPVVSSAPSTTKAVDRIINAIQILINNNPSHAQKTDSKINDIICKLLAAPVEGNLRTPIIWKNTVNIITACESIIDYKSWKQCVEEAFFVDSLQNLTEKNIGNTMVEQLLIVTDNEAIYTNPPKFNYWINIISDFILPSFWKNYECIDEKCQNSIVIPMLSFFNRNMSTPHSISTLSGIHKNPQVAYYTMQILIRAESMLPIGNQIELNELHTSLLTFLQLNFPVIITINKSANYIYPDTPKDVPFKDSVQFFLTKQSRRSSNQYPIFTSSLKSSSLDSGSVTINVSDSESGAGSVSLSNSIIANLVADNGKSYTQLLLTFFDSELSKQGSTIIMQLSKSTNIFPQIFLILSTLFYRLTEALMSSLVKKATTEISATPVKRKIPPVIQQETSAPPFVPVSPTSEIDQGEFGNIPRSTSNSSMNSIASNTSLQMPSPKASNNLVLSLSLTPEVIQAYSDLFDLLLHLRPFLSACQRNIPSERLGPTLLNPILTCQNQFCTFQLVCIFFTIYFDSCHYNPDNLRCFCDKLISMSQLFSFNQEMRNMFNLYSSIFASICSIQLLEMNKIGGPSSLSINSPKGVPISSSEILPSDEQFLTNPVLYAMSSLKIKCQRVPYLFFAFPLHFTNEVSSTSSSPNQEVQAFRAASNRRRSTPLAKTNPDAVAAAQVAASLSKQQMIGDRNRSTALRPNLNTNQLDFPKLSSPKSPESSKTTDFPKLSPTSNLPDSPMSSVPKLQLNSSSDSPGLSQVPKLNLSDSPDSSNIPKMSLNKETDFPSASDFSDGVSIASPPKHFTVSPEIKAQVLSGRTRRLSAVNASNNFYITMNNITAHNFAISFMRGIGKYNNYSHTVKFVETLFTIYLGAKKNNSRCYSSYIYKTICPLLFDIYLHKTDDEIEKDNYSYSKPLLTILNRLIEDLIFRQNVDQKLAISWLKFYIEAIDATSKSFNHKDSDEDSDSEFDYETTLNNKELTLMALSACMNCCCSPFVFRYSIVPIINSRLISDYSSMFSPFTVLRNFTNPNSYISDILRYSASTIDISKKIQMMNSSSTLTNSSSFPDSFQIFNSFVTDSQFKITSFFFTSFYFLFQCEIANDNIKELSSGLVTNFKRLISNISALPDIECLLNLLTVIPYHFDDINRKSPELIPFIFDKLSGYTKTDKCTNEQFTFIIQFATDLICSIDPNEPLFEKVLAFMLIKFDDNTFKNKLRDEYFSFFFEDFMNTRRHQNKPADFYHKSTTGGNLVTIVDNKSEIITFNLFSTYMTISNCYETNNYKLEIVKKETSRPQKKPKKPQTQAMQQQTPTKPITKGQSIEYLISPKTKIDPALMSDVFLSLKKNKQWLLCTPQKLELSESFSDRFYTEKHVIPIVYIGPRQRTVEEILSNRLEQTSEEFINFLSCIGDNVKVEDTSFISSIARVISLIDDPSQSQQQQQLQQQLSAPIQPTPLTSPTQTPVQQTPKIPINQLQTSDSPLSSPSTISTPNLPPLQINEIQMPPLPKHLSPRQRISPRRLSASKKDQDKQQEKAANSHIASRLDQILNLLDEVDNSIYFRNCRHEVLFVPYPSMRSPSHGGSTQFGNDSKSSAIEKVSNALNISATSNGIPESNSISSFVPATISIAWFESPHDKLPKKVLGSMFVIALRPLGGDMFLINVRCNIPQPNKNAPNAINMNEYMKIRSIPFCCKNPFMVPTSALGLVIQDLVLIIENHINYVSRFISTTTQSQALAQLKANAQSASTSSYLVTSDITPSNCFYYASKLAYENAWSVIRKRETMF
ncbi:hypothetical protein M9Y10_008441 [Tritrichomonas musculus]|uniref:Uncharacterized protein n=1 Tax=Tritrichomonas musculus TaxID=1915356 RepID=A0ABR2IZ51_9EUKA